MTVADSKTEILDAVATVMARDGLAGCNMRKVAREAGVSLGLLGYHFDGKQSMVVATFEMVARRLVSHRAAASAKAQHPEARVRSFLHSPFDRELLDGNGPRLLVILWATAPDNATLAAIEQQLATEEAEMLLALTKQLQPVLPVSEQTAATVAALALQRGLVVDWLRAQDSKHLEAGLNAACAQLGVAVVGKL